MSKSHRKLVAGVSKARPEHNPSEAELAKKVAEQEAIQVRDWCLQVLRDAQGFGVSSTFSGPNFDQSSSTFRMSFETQMPTAHAEHIMDWLTEDYYDRLLDEHLEGLEQRRSRTSKL